MQLRLPLDLTVEADARDLRIVVAYLRYKSINRTARELECSRDVVRDAVNRFRWVLERAEKCAYCPPAKVFRLQRGD